MDQFNNNDEFLDFLFSKVVPIKDCVDLWDDDSCCDHLALESAFQLSLF